MKKINFIIALAAVASIISCDSDDDSTEVSCETVELGLATTVEDAITAFAADMQEETCQALKTAIETYRANDCATSVDAYADEFDMLTDDCLPGEMPEVEPEEMV